MRYSPALTGIRFVAIAFVLLEHFAGFIGYPISAGFYGVNLFFVLSGFLITSILISKQNAPGAKTLVNFLARRGLRIFPIYYLVIVILFLIRAPFIDERWPYLVSYTYNYRLAFLDFPSEPYRPMWSLCVEEQFYLFFPIVAIVLRKQKVFLIIACVFLIVIGILQLFFGLLMPMRYNYVSLVTNMIPLAMGAIGAIVSKEITWIIRVLNNKRIEIIMLLVLLVCMILSKYDVQMLAFSIINLCIVLKAYHFNFRIGFINRFLVRKNVLLGGQISYGVLSIT